MICDLSCLIVSRKVQSGELLSSGCARKQVRSTIDRDTYERENPDKLNFNFGFGKFKSHESYPADELWTGGAHSSVGERDNRQNTKEETMWWKNKKYQEQKKKNC